MKKLYVLFFLVLVSSLVMGQKFIITGQVSDTLSNPLPSATVMLLNPKDSSLVSFSVSDARGVFEMKNIDKGTYQVKITFVGLTPFVKNITTPANSTILDVGRLKLEPLSKQLEEVVIRGEKAPVTVKRDTIEFNAGSFKTKANATVEDLLKKLPGVEVETDGTVKAQGEQVQKVTVDGREFFGRDPKLATRNLPADAIEKVQVFDRKSDQAVFTGIDDGQLEKTINLELKEEKRKGAFGNVMGGTGSNDRFQAKASINRFSMGKQLSFLGMGNNINEQGFSIGDFMNFTGGSQQLAAGGGANVQIGGNNQSAPLNTGGRQSGIMTNYAGGLNFNQDLSKNTQLMSNYFYNRLDQNITKQTHRINYLPNDSSYLYDEKSVQLNGSDNHRVNVTVDHRIDSANSVKSTNNLAYSRSDQRSLTNGQTTTVDGVLQNESDRRNFNGQTSMNLNSTLLFRHRFEKKGRTLSTNFTLGLSQTQSNGNQQSINQYYSAVPENKEIIQNNTQKSGNQSYGVTFSYTEPLGGRKYLEGNYTFRTNRNQVDREVFDEKNGQQVINNQLTNKYNSIYIFNRPGLNFKFNRQKFNFTVGASWQNTRLQGDLISKNLKIDRTFENILPVAHFYYDFSSSKHLKLEYETSMQEPSVQQLQPVIDNSDPLNIYMGNPALNPAYQHRISANFNQFGQAKFISLFVRLNATYATNSIVNAQTVSDKFIRVTIPVNVKDNLNINANINFGFPIRKIDSRFTFGPTGQYTKGINVLNRQESHTWQETIGGSVRYNYTFKEILTIDLSANLSHQETRYEFNTQNNQVYFNKTYRAEMNLNFLKNYQFNTSFEYLIYNSQTTSYSQTIPLLDMAISRFILKNRTGELKVGVNNALDYSLSVSQTATANYLQQQITNNLGRYYMVSFTYLINKQLNPMGGRRGAGGGRTMIIRQE